MPIWKWRWNAHCHWIGYNQRLLQQNIQTEKNWSSSSQEIHLCSPTICTYIKLLLLQGYKYVRNTFDLALPHPTVIQSWYRSIGGEPGFTNESFDLLKKHTQTSSQSTICSLTIDKMSICKHVEWDGKQFRGYIDIGTGVQDDTVPPATEALVFMVVVVNSNWKLPVAYFLLDGMNGKDKANLLQQCLCRLDEAGVIVTSVTCDGASSNMVMFRELGASNDHDNLKVSFDHNQRKVYITLDVCHMLKLLRSTFASQTMADGDGHQIK